ELKCNDTGRSAASRIRSNHDVAHSESRHAVEIRTIDCVPDDLVRKLTDRAALQAQRQRLTVRRYETHAATQGFRSAVDQNQLGCVSVTCCDLWKHHGLASGQTSEIDHRHRGVQRFAL